MIVGCWVWFDNYTEQKKKTNSKFCVSNFELDTVVESFLIRISCRVTLGWAGVELELALFWVFTSCLILFFKNTGTKELVGSGLCATNENFNFHSQTKNTKKLNFYATI